MSDIEAAKMRQIIAEELESKLGDLISSLCERLEPRFSRLEARLEAQERKFPMKIHPHPRARFSCSGGAPDGSEDEDGRTLSETDSGLEDSQSGADEEPSCCCCETHEYAFPGTLAPLYLFLRSPSLRRRQRSDTIVIRQRKEDVRFSAQRSLRVKSQSYPEFETIPEGEQDFPQVFLPSLGSAEERQREIRYKERVETYLNFFIQYSNWDCLAASLITKQLLNSDEHQRLCSKDTDSDKGMYFYKHVLPSKGHDAYSRLYACIQAQTMEHSGHTSLLRILDGRI